MPAGTTEPSSGNGGSGKRYRDLDSEERRAYHRERQRRYREADPEHHRELGRKQAARHRQKKASAARRKERARERAATPAEKERLKRFREEHPEKAREYQARWRAKDPEKALRIGREAAMRSNDRRADEVRAKGRIRAAENRAARSAAHKEYYAANKERLAEYARDAARIRRRLAAAGLPPKRVHKSYANEKRANQSAADAFFARKRESDEIEALKRREVLHGAEKDWAAIVRGRLSARDRAEVARRSREFVDAPARLARAIDLALESDSFTRTLRDEVRMDSRAREISGRAPHDLETEVRRRAAATVPQDALDARLLAQQIRNPLWWKAHKGREIKDVLDWARSHSSHSPEHALVKTTITQAILEHRAQRDSSVKSIADQATGPATGYSPTSTALRIVR